MKFYPGHINPKSKPDKCQCEGACGPQNAACPRIKTPGPIVQREGPTLLLKKKEKKET